MKRLFCVQLLIFFTISTFVYGSEDQEKSGQKFEGMKVENCSGTGGGFSQLIEDLNIEDFKKALKSGCSEWTRTSGATCTFAGDSAQVWQRQCENPCGLSAYGLGCDLVRFCHNEDPNILGNSCTKWSREPGTSCYSPNTNNWEQKWVRACQTGIATTWCSDEGPNL